MVGNLALNNRKPLKKLKETEEKRRRSRTRKKRRNEKDTHSATGDVLFIKEKEAAGS